MVMYIESAGWIGYAQQESFNLGSLKNPIFSPLFTPIIQESSGEIDE
jgi:ABC-type cobalt transport system substrate-binding protein